MKGEGTIPIEFSMHAGGTIGRVSERDFWPTPRPSRRGWCNAVAVAVLEDALAEAGFGTDILSSAEEALTVFMGGTKKYKALVTDVHLKGRLSGFQMECLAFPCLIQ